MSSFFSDHKDMKLEIIRKILKKKKKKPKQEAKLHATNGSMKKSKRNKTHGDK